MTLKLCTRIFPGRVTCSCIVPIRRIFQNRLKSKLIMFLNTAHCLLLCDILKLYFLYVSLGGLENRDYGRRDPSCWPRGTLYPQKLPLTSPTSGGRSVGIVRSRTRATGLLLLYVSLEIPSWKCSCLLLLVCACVCKVNMNSNIRYQVSDGSALILILVLFLLLR
jgi:hypothetical protein